MKLNNPKVFAGTRELATIDDLKKYFGNVTDPAASGAYNNIINFPLYSQLKRIYGDLTLNQEHFNNLYRKLDKRVTDTQTITFDWPNITGISSTIIYCKPVSADFELTFQTVQITEDNIRRIFRR